MLDKKRSIFFCFKVLFTVVSLLVAIVAKSGINWPDFFANYIDTEVIEEILYDLSMGIFSSMVLLWFIDEISQILERSAQKQEHQLLQKEYTNVLLQYINEYVKLFNFVVTPVSERSATYKNLPDEIILRNMRDMYKITMDLGMQSPIEAFLEAEQTLKNVFTLYLKTPILSEPIRKNLEDFIRVSNALQCRTVILNAKNQMVGSEPLTEFIAKRLVDGVAEEVCEKIKLGEERSNLLYPYVLLRDMMQKERELIIACLDTINAA